MSVHNLCSAPPATNTTLIYSQIVAFVDTLGGCSYVKSVGLQTTWTTSATLLGTSTSCDNVVINYGAGRFAVAMNTNHGIRTRFSSNAGATWTSEVSVSGSGRNVTSGRTFTMASNSGGSIMLTYASENPSYPAIVERFNGAPAWVNVATAAGRSTNNMLYTDTSFGTRHVLASDGSGFLLAYMSISSFQNQSDIQFQNSDGLNAFVNFGTSLPNTARRNPSFTIAGKGTRGFYVLLTTLYASNNLVAEASADSGRTWSKTRMIRLADTLPDLLLPPTVRGPEFMTVSSQGEFFVAWVDKKTGLGVNRPNIVFSSSNDGYFWSSPEILAFAGDNVFSSPLLVTTGGASYVAVAINDTGLSSSSIVSLKCSYNRIFSPSAPAPTTST